MLTHTFLETGRNNVFEFLLLRPWVS